MEEQITNAGALDGKPELSLYELSPLNVTATVSESGGNDFSSCKPSILDEMDSYMEDLNARLIVSRMVSNSVIKGIASAIEQECAEKISLKEGITNLNNKLQFHDAISENCKKNAIFMEENVVFSHSTLNSSAISHIEHANRLRIEVEDLIQKLKDEFGRATRTDLSQSDNLHVEAGQCRSCSQIEGVHKFEIVEGCIHSLETLLTEMRAYIAAIISSDKTLICEQQSENDIQIDSTTAMLQNLITGLQHEYETIIHDKKPFMIDLKEKWQRKSAELSNVRRELEDLYKSSISLEPGLIFPHVSHEILEERNALKTKDQVHWKPVGNNIASHGENSPILIENVEELDKPIIVDSPQLMCMTKEELITYFKTEMAKMKRQHDVALQEKTEELFSIKRLFFKEKGSNLSNFKKDKEAELMKKRIAETVSKLDDIILENENISTIFYDEGLCSFKEKIDGILLENQRLASLLAAKKKETLHDCSKVLDTSNQLTNIFVGLEDVDQIEKLQWDTEALKIEMSYNDVINKSALRQLSGELRDRVEGMEMETQVDRSIHVFILKEVVRDVLFRIKIVMMKCYEEKDSLSEILSEKKKELCLELEKNKILKEQIESSSTLLKMKEKLASDLEASVIQQSEQLDSICHERDMLRDQVYKQEVIIAETKNESDLLKCRLEDRFHDVDRLQNEINKINQNFKIVSDALLDAEKQKNILQSKLIENQAELASEIKKGKEQRKQVKLMLTFMLELPKSLEELQHKIIDIMECNESRLKVLSCISDKLLQRAKKFLLYKEVFERRCEDLHKAETEVDLLGDEVDQLISLLGKIYLALEHYSSVLQYYPGVMETLNLIRREIKGE
ncbi:WPP domain-associated protein [Dendrobium catenatum]|uniref:WPP domain-associated protein n=1 Tax=Dendrobium catenatum TaxID=906689 RepID=UPI0009F4CF88|nr:WPP domain-associated protein [Dendrobium catenatum]